MIAWFDGILAIVLWLSFLGLLALIFPDGGEQHD
ncbi:hypothetical protein CathTA2_2429 [Caldalkalibacillus thermarum TA2.A1]|uniref:Uncharacterized protein n=1 Tax=Caldalkalibacillus thermarum (strain TA2.A1) TaxID=986075 RepID=F5L9C4_CALTT|nr:hypothetical protein CathTA2_2429 [Caldalkalibacillus thermarum TA2.A1]